MKVFISWSKDSSRAVAEALKDWLPDVIQTLEPWMSSADIGAGARWSSKIAEALASTRIGILCVTAENQREPWLLFEAGALAKTLEDTYVCPYLIKMRPADLAVGPLTQFQAKLADHDGTFELMSAINTALGPEALPADRLKRLFERSWPHLETRLSALPQSSARVHRPQDELLTEILETVRTLARRLPPPPSRPSPEEEAVERRRYDGFMIKRHLRDKFPQETIDQFVAHLRDIPNDELHQLARTLRGSRELPPHMKQWLTSLAAAVPSPAGTLGDANALSTPADVSASNKQN